jgi:hypothetical protein
VNDAQNLVTIPRTKSLRKLAVLSPTQLATVEAAVREWLGLYPADGFESGELVKAWVDEAIRVRQDQRLAERITPHPEVMVGTPVPKTIFSRAGCLQHVLWKTPPC